MQNSIDMSSSGATWSRIVPTWAKVLDSVNFSTHWAHLGTQICPKKQPIIRSNSKTMSDTNLGPLLEPFRHKFENLLVSFRKDLRSKQGFRWYINHHHKPMVFHWFCHVRGVRKKQCKSISWRSGAWILSTDPNRHPIRSKFGPKTALALVAKWCQRWSSKCSGCLLRFGP